MDKNLVAQFDENQSNIAAMQAKIIAATESFQKQLKTMQDRDTQLREALKEGMEASGIRKLSTETVDITYVAATERKTLDTAAIKEQEPDVYERYLKVSNVKSSIRIKVKNG